MTCCASAPISGNAAAFRHQSRLVTFSTSNSENQIREDERVTEGEKRAKRSSTRGKGAETEVTSSADYVAALGRYALYGEIAAGGMATVHIARLIGSVGFARTVAIKRLHPHLAKDPDFVSMFLEEARLAARVRHPNVVATLDVVQEDNELFLVMEYVAGESLSRLVRKTREKGGRIPPRFVVAMVCQALEGLHAAHDATSERGTPLGIVHRDVSPQNIHVGIDGVARVLDFGIAKATNRVQETRTDQIKGKVAYMSPEQLAKGPIDRRADVYSASVLLWEALTGARLFKADDVPSLVYSIMNDEIKPPSQVAPDLPLGMDAIVMKGLERDASKRWESARAMAVALEKILPPAAPRDIGEWVVETGGDALAWRLELVQRIESETSASIPPGALRAHAQYSPSEPIEVSSGVGLVLNPPERSESDATTHDLDGSNDAVPVANVIPRKQKSPPRSNPRPVATPAEALSVPTAPPDVEGDEAGEAMDVRGPAPSIGDFNEIGVVSEVTDLAGHAKRERSRVVVFALIAAGVLLVAGALLALRLIQLQGDGTTTTAPSPSESSSNEPAISLGISRTAPSAKPKASASDSAGVAPPKPPVTIVAPQPTPTPTPTPTANPDCENPFYVDGRGVRHPKPHCFKR